MLKGGDENDSAVAAVHEMKTTFDIEVGMETSQINTNTVSQAGDGGERGTGNKVLTSPKFHVVSTPLKKTY
jgi:hypothetical protein